MGFKHTSLIFGTGGDGLGGLWLLRDVGVSAFFISLFVNLKSKLEGAFLSS